MDGSRFDTWTRRRFGLASGGMATALLGLGLAGRDPTRLTAKQRHKRRKSLVFNAFGCLNVDKPCRGWNDLCCSGICAGKKPKKGKPDKSRCVAHDTGGCQPGVQDAS